MQICHALHIAARAMRWLDEHMHSNRALAQGASTGEGTTQKQGLCNNPIQKKLKFFTVFHPGQLPTAITSADSFQTQIET